MPKKLVANKPSSVPKITDFEKHETNPFTEKVIQDVQLTKKYRRTGTTKSIHQIVNTESGEIEGHTMMVKEITVDEDKFAKLYLSKFQAWLDLPPAAMKLFAYVMTKLKPKIDSFEFNMAECQRYTGYSSKQPIYDALAHLVRGGIIARGYHEYIYFINPMIAFNGDRVSYMETFVKAKSEKAKKSVSNKTHINQLAIELA